MSDEEAYITVLDTLGRAHKRLLAKAHELGKRLDVSKTSYGIEFAAWDAHEPHSRESGNLIDAEVEAEMADGDTVYAWSFSARRSESEWVLDRSLQRVSQGNSERTVELSDHTFSTSADFMTSFLALLDELLMVPIDE